MSDDENPSLDLPAEQKILQLTRKAEDLLRQLIRRYPEHGNKTIEALLQEALIRDKEARAEAVLEPPARPRAAGKLKPISKIVPAVVTDLAAVRAANVSPVRRRLTKRELEDRHQELVYQHTVFCQTGLPYRDPGDDVRVWQRGQGRVSLLIEAGRAWDAETGKWVKLGLPWGTKPRLILAHLNAEALQNGSPEIEVGNSLSAFVDRVRGFNGGREIRAFKNQLACLSVANIRLGMVEGGQVRQIQSPIVSGFELWPELDDRQRVLWPATVTFSTQYWNSLQNHAVPLPEEDLKALAHSAMALDIFAWLAQRLHRIPRGIPAPFITWARLKEQFGPGYDQMSNFKRKFRVALRQVLVRYHTAQVELDDHGMKLHHSPSPAAKRMVLMPPETPRPQT
jgi:hypothetical protein